MKQKNDTKKVSDGAWEVAYQDGSRWLIQWQTLLVIRTAGQVFDPPWRASSGTRRRRCRERASVPFPEVDA